jgi:bile acid:Na+ symporter, BASS family
MNLEAFVPIIVVLLMVIVGTEVIPSRLGAVLRAPGTLAGATVAQFLLLPLLALPVILLLRPPPELAGGLLLVAASPGGALSNYYCLLGRLNVALSVTLTAFSGIAAVAIMPVALAVIAPIGLGLEAFSVPIAELALRLLLFLVLPVGVGMMLRQLWPAALERYDGAIRGFGLGLLVLFLAIVVVDQRDAVFEMISDATRVTLSFTALALLTGWLFGRLFGLNGPDRTVLAIEFAVRNVAIAAVLALSTFRQPEFAAFGALFLLFQFPVLILLLLARRRLRSASPDPV